jgi:UDP-N-acetylmuramate dehydrogenase
VDATTIQEHISLKDLTTFKIGGEARFFATVHSIDELKGALAWAKEKHLEIFVLGGGSNILMGDKGWDGLVIKIEIKGIELKGNELVGGAGENWDSFVGYAVEHGLYGIENLSLIPGSVGATPVQNIGAYGVEVKDTISWVESINSETGELKIFNNNECGFAYRDSFFKKPEGKKYIITRVAFNLKKEGILSTEYRDIKKYIEENKILDLTLQKIRDIVIDIRTKKLPDVRIIGTAGSFFKNPIISLSDYQNLLTRYPDLPGYSQKSAFAGATADTIKIPAAWMLDNLCGFKGYKEGDVGVYKNQALVLVNFGNAKAQDIFDLSEKMIACVKEKTNIILEREVQMIL